MVVDCWCGRSSRPGIFTDRHFALLKRLKPLIALHSAHTVIPVCLVKQLKCLCKHFTKFAAKFHTHVRCSSSSFIVTLSLIRRTACARAQFSGRNSTTSAHSQTGQMAVCCQTLTLGAHSSHSALSVLVGALFKKFALFLNTPRVYIYIYISLSLSVICQTTGPKPLPKLFLRIVRSRSSSFNWQYPLLSLRSSSSFLRLLPRLLIISICPFIFPSITCCRRQFLRKMWPIHLAFRFLISCKIFLCSLTVSNNSSFVTW